MKIGSLDTGLESVTRVRPRDEARLPAEGPLAPAFVPQPAALDAVLRRPSLDERLPDLLQPRALDPGLLQPAALTEARLAAGAAFATAARRATGHRRRILDEASRMLAEDAALDDEVRTALAALLRA
ncbi:hypothetical protein [Methylobacterium oryzihabitans]|jgi:hypothetical protein|uniref:Uncharacterized protein n=1 Tax=Methylobacterium oryzihabitans TaxID=2499852 RepID=A0A437NRC4_9HYPH|nr:hypothetical protein [Methylobacterium oryzihabitans]RVU12575.1 hypothetical protein EOE48_27570 [Methylobacterium oryzihabitans]